MHDSPQVTWDKAEGLEKAIERQESSRELDEDDAGYTLATTIARLKLASSPTTFWRSMMAEAPARTAGNSSTIEAHKLFCEVAINISAIVGHTCGVERAGKAYKLVWTAHRKAMNPATAHKAIFVLCNYGLLKSSVELGDGFDEFGGSILLEEEESDRVTAARVHALRRGRILSEDDVVDENEELEGSDSSPDTDEEGEGAAAVAPRAEVRWSQLDEGLVPLDKPSSLGEEAVGKLIFMRWENFGWLLGTITQRITRETPRLHAKYNFRIKWFDGWENHQLLLDNYEGGASAPYNSWVFLAKRS